MDLIYKDQDSEIIKTIELTQEKTPKPKKRRKSSTLDPELIHRNEIERIFENLKKLSNSNEYYHILEQLQEDIQLCPIAITRFIETNNIYDCFKIILDDPQHPELVFSTIYKCIQSDKNCALSFIPGIPEIFNYIYHPNVSQLCEELLKTILKICDKLDNQNNHYDIFIFENIFENIQHQNPLFHPFSIIQSIYKECSDPVFKTNLPILYINLQTLFSQVFQSHDFNDEQRYYHLESYIKLFRELLSRMTTYNKKIEYDFNPQTTVNQQNEDYQNQRIQTIPQTILTPSIFNHMIDFLNETGCIECLRLINAILVFEYDNSPFAASSFFLGHKDIFPLLINFLEIVEFNKRSQLVMRIYSNFTHFPAYLDCIVECQVYLNLFDFFLSADFPFNFYDDFAIVICRVFCKIPENVAADERFPNLFEMILNSIGSETSEFLDQDIIDMLECLEIYIPKLHLPINYDDVLSRVSESCSVNVEDWLIKKTEG